MTQETQESVYTLPEQIATPMDITNYTGIPVGLMQQEIHGIYGAQLLKDLGRIIRYYEIYEYGAKFATEGSNGDYVPAALHYQRAATLIDKEARFIFGRPAEFILGPEDPEDDTEATKQDVSNLQTLIDNVLSTNRFPDKCLKGFKDACIGERVGITVDFNEKGIFTKFHPSYSFVYEVDEYETIVKFIVFYTLQDSMDKNTQRIYKKKWELDEGACVITEEVFDGAGRKIEDESEEPIVTEFDYLPVWVVLNDGLTGDLDGESEIKRLANYESWYSKLANADIDAGRQGMNPVRWARDMTPESTENLSIAAGAFWDLTSNKDADESMTGEVGVLETNMSYSDPLGKTLDRLATAMNDTIDVPNISADSMSGVITSGKTLRAIYWPLTMRSDEKMIAWEPALRFVANTIIDGARKYPDSVRRYLLDPVPDIPYSLKIENPYSLPEDEAEEKALDLQEVNNQTMSRKRYIKKWQNTTDKEADKELQQIALERQLLEDAYTGAMSEGTLSFDNLTNGGSQAQENPDGPELQDGQS